MCDIKYDRKTDTAVSTHRCQILIICKGGNLKKMIAEIHGKKGGAEGQRRVNAFDR